MCHFCRIRLKINRVAEKLKLAPSTIHSRIKKLEARGVIKNYAAILDPQKVGKGFVAFLFGEPKYSPKLSWDKTAEKLKKINGVQEVFFLSGQDDFLIKVRTKDAKEYSKTAEEVAKILNKNAHGMIAPKTEKESRIYELRPNS